MRGSQLTLHHVSKRYPGRTVLDQVSFTLKPGEKAGSSVTTAPASPPSCG